MKLAVVDHVGNPGGGSRVIRALVPALKQLRPDMQIVYFGNPGSIKRENILKEFTTAGIEVRELKSLRFSSKGILGFRGSDKIICRIQESFSDHLSFLPFTLSGAVHKELESVLREFDLAYFAWPFLLKCPKLNCPMVGTFHDFNFKYFFGADIFNRRQLHMLNNCIPVWLANSTPVVSTNFMASELTKFYPEFADKVKVVHLAPPSIVSNIDEKQAQRIVTRLGINKPYIIYPTHLTVHKNIGPLLTAVWILNEMKHEITLVLTGRGTETATGRACRIGVEKGNIDPNVIGLGYVSNDQMDALIQCAVAVVTTSLYEAGNGPGLDGWSRAVPVAMSNIPSFLEHLEVQNVRAEVFDPRSPNDIAIKIRNILCNPEKAKADALHSKEALSKLTWAQTAKKYLAIFDEAVKGGSNV